MTFTLLTLLLGISFSSLTACGDAQTSSLNRMPRLHSEAPISIVNPEAGIDYPTDVATPLWIQGRRVLLIDKARILVNESADLDSPKAGIDFPTDSMMPASLKGKTLLVVDDLRLPINIEKAKAGIDYPTDGPAHLERDFKVWDLGDFRRIRLSRIVEIRQAEAGIDYPTDGPAELDRDFHVMIVENPDFSRDRIVLDR